MTEKLRLGILLDNYHVNAWTIDILKELKYLPDMEINLVVKNAAKNNGRKRGSGKVFGNFRTLLYRIYRKIDKKIFKSKRDAFAKADVRKILNADCLEIMPIQTKYIDKFKTEDLERIRSYEVDVFIRLGFRILRGEILSIAPYGIWSFHHGDNSLNRGMPAGFWEVIFGWPVTGATLQVLDENLDGGMVLSKTHSLTDRFSVSRNRNNYYLTAATMLVNELQALLRKGGDQYLREKRIENEHPDIYSNPLYKIPSNGEMFYYFIKLLLKKVKFSIQNIFYFQQWILYYHMDKVSGDAPNMIMYKYKKILPPKDRFWADPYIIENQGRFYVFIEELLYREQRGKISFLEIDEDGIKGPARVIIEEDFHLSNPFIFEDNGDLFMIPESKQNSEIRLYKCLNFPDKWQFEEVLMSGIQGVDAIILKKDGLYWLFTNVVKYNGASSLDQLHIFYSENLQGGTWIAHKNNPIISDVRRARPAGKFFTYNGNLYRPSQNSSYKYGYGIQINKVLQLNKESYKEEQIGSISPKWEKHLQGTHTINRSGKLSVIDGWFNRSKFF